MMCSFEQASKTKKEEDIKSKKWVNKFRRKVKRIPSKEKGKLKILSGGDPPAERGASRRPCAPFDWPAG